MSTSSTRTPILNPHSPPHLERPPTLRFPVETNGIVADVLVDTDVFVDHLRGAHHLAPKRHRVHYSVITRAELFAGNTATNLVSTLLAPFREVPVDREVAERAGRIRRETGIRLPDALIAATAIERKLGLATRNRGDFEQVRGLRLRSLS
ncbi:MAG: PIN domain-containing protein [Actinobacteria bacterium]|nr:PIN domain-containing protein [Actinomycetota bacterium]